MFDNAIMSVLAGGGDVDTAIRKETLRAAVMRKIMCDVTGEVLDVRTAVYIGTSGQSFVIPGTLWDSHETPLREGIAAQGWEITDVIDGRALA